MNFYQDYSIYKLQIKKVAAYFIYAKCCPWMHLYNIYFLQMNCFLAHSFIRKVFLEIFIHSHDYVRHCCRYCRSTKVNKNVSLFSREYNSILSYELTQIHQLGYKVEGDGRCSRMLLFLY